MSTHPTPATHGHTANADGKQKNGTKIGTLSIIFLVLLLGSILYSVLDVKDTTQTQPQQKVMIVPTPAVDTATKQSITYPPHKADTMIKITGKFSKPVHIPLNYGLVYECSHDYAVKYNNDTVRYGKANQNITGEMVHVDQSTALSQQRFKTTDSTTTMMVISFVPEPIIVKIKN